MGADELDEVDGIVAAWQRERPDLDTRPMQVLSRVTRLARHLDRARRAAFAAHALEPWEFDVLSALRRSGPPYQLSPGRLVTETMVTSGTMTNRVDRLAGRGLVAVDAALDELLEQERSLLSSLDPDDADTLAASLRTLARHV